MASHLEEVRKWKMVEEVDKQKRAGSREILRLEAVFSRYVGHVYTLCLRLLADVRAAEAATTSVLVRFSREMARWWNESQIRSRLCELAIDEALALLRGRSEKSGPSTEVPFTPAAPSTARDKAHASLDRATLEALSAQLPERLRVAFVLSDREGLSDRAIAAHLQANEAEVRRLVHTARLALRRLWLGQKQERKE